MSFESNKPAEPSADIARYCLYLDTTGPVLRLALGDEAGRLFWTHQEPTENQRYHSAVMIPLIQRGLDTLNIAISDLSSVAVVTGPGSFTGIRTGISSVRALGQFLPVKISAFSQFELLACYAACQELDSSGFPIPEQTPKPVLIVIDALRDRAYCAELAYSPDAPVNRAAVQSSGFILIQPPALMPLAEITPRQAGQVWISPSLESHGQWELIRENTGESDKLLTIELIPESMDTPALMAALLTRHLGCFEKDWADVLPLYLQEPNITMRKPQPGKMK